MTRRQSNTRQSRMDTAVFIIGMVALIILAYITLTKGAY